MPIYYLLVLAIVQGITEFLPISSSGHLVLVAKFIDFSNHSLTLDVAMHVGTLGAVLIYLWRDIGLMFWGVFEFFSGNKTLGGKLFLWLIIGTIPVAGCGYILNQYFPNGIRDIQTIAWMTLIFGVFLMLSDKIGMTFRRIEHLRFADVILISIVQVLALIPGTSRSGVCITAGRFLGMERAAAARFSLLLSIPAILGAGSLKGYDLWQSDNLIMTDAAFLAAVIAFLVAFISIFLMMAWLRKSSLTPFAIYRILLGGLLLVAPYFGSF